MAKVTLIIASLLLIYIQQIYGVYVPAAEWSEYKLKYNKTYSTSVDEANAEYYYAYNKNLVNYHNNRIGLTFKLNMNHLSDMRLIHFNALFPVVKPLTINYASAAPQVLPAPPSYIPADDIGLNSTVADQGVKCNSGWAYSAVKSIELLQAEQMVNLNPLPLSAQNIIDCAGSVGACKNQLPQTAFDYLTRYGMGLNLESDYMNNNTLTDPGMCVPKTGTVVQTTLAKYSLITNGDDDKLKAYVGAGFPVIVEVNPTSFEFMHYSQGVYQPQAAVYGSHNMVVIGYGTDTVSGLDYWLMQNSFGPHWGENGYIKWIRSATVKLTKNAIFPSELA